MPCDSITTMGVELGAVHPEAFAAALKALGLTGDIYEFYGTLEGISFSAQRAGTTLNIRAAGYVGQEGVQKITAALKRQMSRQIVLRQAKRAGWQVKEQGGKIQLIKR